MATYAVFTSSSTTITLTFNTYSAYNNYDTVKWRKDEFAMVSLLTDGSIVVRAKHGTTDYTLSYDGSKGMRIESVDGVAPTDATHLFNMISALLN